VSVSDAYCTGTTSGQATVTVTPLPTAVLSGSPAICDGQSTNLSIDFSGVAPFVYSYTDGSTVFGPFSTSQNPASVPVSPAATTTYSPTATLTINAGSLAAGCYQFTLRAQGTNDDGQPVIRLHLVEFTVAATSGPSEYVDVIGFAVFEITSLGANSIEGRAITGVFVFDLEAQGHPDDTLLEALSAALAEAGDATPVAPRLPPRETQRDATRRNLGRAQAAGRAR